MDAGTLAMPGRSGGVRPRGGAPLGRRLLVRRPICWACRGRHRLVAAGNGDEADNEDGTDHPKPRQIQQRDDAWLSKFIIHTGIIKQMTYRITDPDGTGRVELSVTMRDDVEVQPLRNGIMEETPKRTEEVATAPVQQATPPPPKDQDEETPPPPQEDEETKSHQPWRMFLIPEDHVFVVHCASDDELIIHIKPRSDALAHRDNQPPITCGKPPQQHDDAGGVPSLFDGGSYRALFWSVSDEEEEAIVVPLPSSRPLPDLKKVIKAILKDKRERAAQGKMVPESVRLSPDMVMFYRPVMGNTEVLVAPSDSIEYLDIADKPECHEVVSLLAQHAVLSTSFSTHDAP